MEAFLNHLGGRSGASWGPLGNLFGASWGPLGASWGRLGSLLGPPGGLLGPRARKVRSGTPSGHPLGVVLGGSWAVLEVYWAVLGRSWGPVGPSRIDPAREAARQRCGVESSGRQFPRRRDCPTTAGLTEWSLASEDGERFWTTSGTRVSQGRATQTTIPGNPGWGSQVPSRLFRKETEGG